MKFSFSPGPTQTAFPCSAVERVGVERGEKNKEKKQLLQFQSILQCIRSWEFNHMPLELWNKSPEGPELSCTIGRSKVIICEGKNDK